MMRSRSGIVLVVALLVQLLACAAATSERKTDDWDSRSPSALTGDLDAAEMRWRKEIAASRAEEDRLLTDDPPGAPKRYGKVAFTEEVVEEEPAMPLTRWERFKVGAAHFGKATFAAMTVVVTLGMMAAPYLIPAV